MSRSVLVTGANSGIGLQTALHLGRIGFRVVGTARTEEKAETLRSAAHDAGVDVDTAVLDVTDPDGCRAVVDRHELYAVVNNAGYMNVGAVEDVEPETALLQLHTLVVAPMRLATLALPGMRRRGAGRIVNVSSVSARVTGPLVGWYQAAKHALSAVSDALRAEVEGSGIEVVLIEPGAFRTAIWAKAADDLRRRHGGSFHADAYERVLEMLPTLEPRAQDPALVAEAIGEALTAGKPQDRYLVGPDAALLEVAHLMTPPSARARLSRMALGLLGR